METATLFKWVSLSTKPEEFDELIGLVENEYGDDKTAARVIAEIAQRREFLAAVSTE